MSNEGFVRNYRQALRPNTPGVQPLTTLWQQVLEETHVTDSQWVLGGSRVVNYSNSATGGGPCDYDLAYLPAELEAVDITDEHLCGGTPVAARDFHQIGSLLVCRGYTLWAKAEKNGYLNILLCTDEVE